MAEEIPLDHAILSQHAQQNSEIQKFHQGRNEIWTHGI